MAGRRDHQGNDDAGIALWSGGCVPTWRRTSPTSPSSSTLRISSSARPSRPARSSGPRMSFRVASPARHRSGHLGDAGGTRHAGAWQDRRVGGPGPDDPRQRDAVWPPDHRGGTRRSPLGAVQGDVRGGAVQPRPQGVLRSPARHWHARQGGVDGDRPEAAGDRRPHPAHRPPLAGFPDLFSNNKSNNPLVLDAGRDSLTQNTVAANSRITPSTCLRRGILSAIPHLESSRPGCRRKSRSGPESVRGRAGSPGTPRRRSGSSSRRARRNQPSSQCP